MKMTENPFPMGFTSEQYETYLKMMILRAEKSEGYRVHVLKRWFPLRRLTCPAIIGTFALTSPQTKQRWMLESQTFEFEGMRVTPTDLARDYLVVKYGSPKNRKITTSQYRNFYDNRRHPPVYALPGVIPSAAYVDIKSAYWSILLALGWDVDYNPSGWLKKKSSVSDFPFPSIKMARNCLVSVAASPVGSMKIWTGKELISKRSGNAFVNRMLWTVVMDILNGIAGECVQAGASYCYTDGFICPTSRAETLLQIISSWGLRGDIKYQGDCEIKGAAAYRIGGHKTKKFDIVNQRPCDKIDYSVSVPFLKPRVKFFADRSNR